MSLTSDQVRHVAALARLELSDDEVRSLVADLGQILGHVEQLRALDTDDAEASLGPAIRELPLAPDVPHTGLSHDAALAPAARTLSDGFAVPAFVDEG
jgi:aspartyl-tRNA(Asn)/glutamyl-tRNA(Gln) amidotransferase subunit C